MLASGMKFMNSSTEKSCTKVCGPYRAGQRLTSKLYLAFNASMLHSCIQRHTYTDGSVFKVIHDKRHSIWCTVAKLAIASYHLKRPAYSLRCSISCQLGTMVPVYSIS